MESQDSPLLTIIIPTRNRMDTAIPTIRSVLSIPCPDLEVLVQDCSDTPELGDHLRENIHDKRLCYHHSPPPLSMVENWNIALPLATGEFVCVIGDDDGVNPEIIRAACWAREHRLDAVAPSQCAVFWWPNFPRKELAGNLRVYPFTGAIQYPDIDRQLVFSSHGFGQRTLLLPRAYQGVVRRELLCALYRQTGKFFDAIAPDYYIPYALATVTGRYAMVDYPLVIIGASGKSNTGRTNVRTRTNRDAIRLHLQEFKTVDWDALLPPYCNGGSIMCEGMITAFRNTRREDLISNINFPLLYASCLMHELPHTATIVRHLLQVLKGQKQNQLIGFLLFLAYFAGRVVQRILVRTTQKFYAWTGREPVAARHVQNMEEAMQALTRHLQATGRQFTPKPEEAGLP
jgi:glycosyltransferase involved in cell wall biosynthesis